ncbi:unnamed protein product, partial [Allacma fusca]
KFLFLSLKCLVVLPTTCFTPSFINHLLATLKSQE